MWKHFFLCFLGLCSGSVISAGLAGLIISLAILPRYAGISHTENQIFLYESVSILGILGGNLFSLFSFTPPGGVVFLLIMGTGFGIFLGAWILALEEISNVLPIFSRRLHIRKGFSAFILSLALGKVLGSLYYFYHSWQ